MWELPGAGASVVGWSVVIGIVEVIVTSCLETGGMWFGVHDTGRRRRQTAEIAQFPGEFRRNGYPAISVERLHVMTTWKSVRRPLGGR